MHAMQINLNSLTRAVTSRSAPSTSPYNCRRAGSTIRWASNGSGIFDTSRLHGRNVLITGASAGIGASTAHLFARAGSNLILVARRADRLKHVKERCMEAYRQYGNEDGKVILIEADMTRKADVEGISEKCQALDVDILVNNAGLVRGRDHVGDIADEDIDAMFQTNVMGMIRLTQLFVKEMKKRNSGMIINLGSIAGREAYAGGSIYCATKHAVAAFSESMMKELVNTNIRVCEIQPGMVETEFSVVRFKGDQARADNEYKGLTPLTGDDIAEQIVWCASRPEHVQIAQMLIFPTAQASATISHRKS